MEVNARYIADNAGLCQGIQEMAVDLFLPLSHVYIFGGIRELT